MPALALALRDARCAARYIAGEPVFAAATRQ